jgi:hypothetical protein
MREVDDPNVVLIPHEQVAEEWRARRAELLKQTRETGGES